MRAKDVVVAVRSLASLGIRLVARNDDEGAGDAGAAYLYDLDGTFLASINNPSPDSGDAFGLALAGLPGRRFVLTVPREDIPASNAGGAYLCSLGRVVDGLVAQSVAVGAVGLAQLDAAAIDDRYVNRTGDTMSGPLQVENDTEVTGDFRVNSDDIFVNGSLGRVGIGGDGRVGCRRHPGQSL